MDATAFDIVMKYSAACNPSPIVSHILMCIAYVMPSPIKDFSGCLLKGARTGDNRSNFYGMSEKDKNAIALSHLENLLSHSEERISKRIIASVTGYSDGTIGKHKRLMLADNLIDDDWSLRCDVLEKRTAEACSRVTRLSLTGFEDFKEVENNRDKFLEVAQ